MWTSVRQTPQALTSSSSSPGPGSGSGTSAIRRARPGASRTAARIGRSSTLGGMPARTDIFDLGRLSLSPGEARHLDLQVSLGDFKFGTESYSAEPRDVPVRLDVTRMASGWSLR